MLTNACRPMLTITEKCPLNADEDKMLFKDVSTYQFVWAGCWGTAIWYLPIMLYPRNIAYIDMRLYW